jgi:hypothetical protein
MAAATLARKSRPLFWLGAACLAVGWLIVIVETAFGMRVPLPQCLMLVSGCMCLASTAAQSTQPKLSEYLIFAAALVSVAAVIFIVMTHP